MSGTASGGGKREPSQRGLLVAARRAARDAQSGRQEAARARERRVVDLATQVIVNADERDLVVARTERQMGEALRRLVEEEGLSVREALVACGSRIDGREAARLRRAAQSADPVGGAESGETAGQWPGGAPSGFGPGSGRNVGEGGRAGAADG